MKVLFICLANVGRSQMAEAFYNQLTSSSNAESASVKDYSAKYQNPTPDIISAMNEVGIDVSKQKVKFISQKKVDKADKIVVLCKKEECPDFLQASSKVVYKIVDDPDGYSAKEIGRVRDEIKEMVGELIKENDTIRL